jgi:glycosyltransferase involved in cell wall biosynthesis
VKRPLNILLVADVSIESVIGGAERVLYEESTRLAKKGHTVHVLTRRLRGHNSAMREIDGVEEWRYGFHSKPFPFFVKSIFVDCRRVFTSMLSKYSFDLINFHQPFSATGVISSLACQSISTVYTCLSFSFEEYASRTAFPNSLRAWSSYRLHLFGRKLVEKRLLEKAARIVVLSEYTREKLNEVYGLRGPKISIIPGGVDLERFRPPVDKARILALLGLPEDKFILFTVRNLVPRMGLENLISAFEIVKNARRDVLLVIGGEGPLEPELKQQTKQCGVEDFVRFAGYIPDEDLPSYYQMADLFILPTIELEGFGLVTVEALASGLPVLGTPIGGTREILARLGPEYLFDDVTPESMAITILNALNNWGKDSSAYKAISRSCRRVAEEHYSWENHVSKLEELFYSMIGN